MSFIPKTWLLAFAGILLVMVVIAGLQIRRQAAEIEAAQQEVAAQRARADQNAAAVLALTAAQEHNERIASEVAEIRRAMRATSDSIVGEIASAPPEDDAPLSPLMLRALERLRDAAPRNAGGGSEPGHSDGTPEVRAPGPAAANDDAKGTGDVADAGSYERLVVRDRRRAASEYPIAFYISAANSSSEKTRRIPAF